MNQSQSQASRKKSPSSEGDSFLDTINPPVFFTAAFSLIALLLFSVITPDRAITLFTAVKDSILKNFSWFYLFTVIFLFGFCMWLAFSRFGGIVLGDANDKPEYSRSSWYAMLLLQGWVSGWYFMESPNPWLIFAFLLLVNLREL